MVIDVPVSAADTAAEICNVGALVFVREEDNAEYYAVANMSGVKSALAYRGSDLIEIYGGENVNEAVINTAHTVNGSLREQVWTFTINRYDESRDIYYFQRVTASGKTQPDEYVYPDVESALNAIAEAKIRYPITYRLTNCTAPDAPTEAAVGDSVSVSFVFTEGYGITVNANVYVTNNGVIVPSTYSDGVLTFEMPNPN